MWAIDRLSTGFLEFFEQLVQTVATKVVSVPTRQAKGRWHPVGQGTELASFTRLTSRLSGRRQKPAADSPSIDTRDLLWSIQRWGPPAVNDFA